MVNRPEFTYEDYLMLSEALAGLMAGIKVDFEGCKDKYQSLAETMLVKANRVAVLQDKIEWALKNEV